MMFLFHFKLITKKFLRHTTTNIDMHSKAIRLQEKSIANSSRKKWSPTKLEVAWKKWVL